MRVYREIERERVISERERERELARDDRGSRRRAPAAAASVLWVWGGKTGGQPPSHSPRGRTKRNKTKQKLTFTAPIWFCFAIFLMSAMSFFSWLCRLFLSRSSSRMDLSSMRLFSLRYVCEVGGLNRNLVIILLETMSAFDKRHSRESLRPFACRVCRSFCRVDRVKRSTSANPPGSSSCRRATWLRGCHRISVCVIVLDAD